MQWAKKFLRTSGWSVGNWKIMWRVSRRRAIISRSYKCWFVGGGGGRGFIIIGSMEVPDHRERPLILEELDGRPQGYSFSKSGGRESEGAIITTVNEVSRKRNLRPIN